MNSNGNCYTILDTQGFNFQTLTVNDTSDLYNYFYPTSITYDAEEMQKVEFSPYSETEWTISPPSMKKFISDFDNIVDVEGSYVDIRVQWSFYRENLLGTETATGYNEVRINSTEF